MEWRKNLSGKSLCGLNVRIIVSEEGRRGRGLGLNHGPQGTGHRGKSHLGDLAPRFPVDLDGNRSVGGDRELVLVMPDHHGLAAGAGPRTHHHAPGGPHCRRYPHRPEREDI